MRTTSGKLRVAFAQDLPALAQPTCSTEDDTRSRREGTHVRRRRHSEGCTRASNFNMRNWSSRDGTSLSRTQCVGAKDIPRGELCAGRKGHGSDQRAQHQNIRCVICSAHDGQPERQQTCSHHSDLVLVESVRGMWMAS